VESVLASIEQERPRAADVEAMAGKGTRKKKKTQEKKEALQRGQDRLTWSTGGNNAI